ncbi:Uu.00g113770.m01.CDS01 [Anthostomella pinea]|uniref:Uu.00g113770.m01.CDS01 n=1 Tax=Anthostomella pinea TaxID=933095 RepID=A0AAI8VFF3_9PEZI|nr:Uu.00g113770.m01.CDS01 [Anthostomella pinea]
METAQAAAAIFASILFGIMGPSLPLSAEGIGPGSIPTSPATLPRQLKTGLGWPSAPPPPPAPPSPLPPVMPFGDRQQLLLLCDRLCRLLMRVCRLEPRDRRRCWEIFS